VVKKKRGGWKRNHLKRKHLRERRTKVCIVYAQLAYKYGYSSYFGFKYGYSLCSTSLSNTNLPSATCLCSKKVVIRKCI
jgi:hypothetical protein